MANVTFSAPILAKDVTVYAVAGSTVLSVAKAANVAIPCQCEDGECGSCLVKISVLSAPHGVNLTDKEKLTLSVNGKLTKGQLAELEVKDVAPPYRLACQATIRDEDILVEFSGEPGVEIDLRR